MTGKSFIYLFAISMLFLFNPVIGGASETPRWKLVFVSENGFDKTYVDTVSINHVSSKVVRFWKKTVNITEEDVSFIELDCSLRTITFIENIHFNIVKGRKIPDPLGIEKGERTFNIPPAVEDGQISQGEGLMLFVCVQGKENK